MNWLESISQIKGQIGNLTKDLLSEDNHEPRDFASELSIAHSRVKDLEQLVETHKNEIDSLRSKNDELQLQLESAQLRLDHAKDHFQSLLDGKEVLISQLRLQISTERGEPEGRPEVTPTATHRGDHNFIISDQNILENASATGTLSWEELKNEVIKLRAELSKWKRIARRKQNKSDDAANQTATKNLDLEKELDNLKAKLHDSEETRRSELIALQEAHTDRLSNLVEQLKDSEAEVLRLRAEVERYSSVAKQTGSSDLLQDDTTQDNHLIHSVINEPVQDVSQSKPTIVSKKKKKKATASASQEVSRRVGVLETDTQTVRVPLVDSTTQITADSIEFSDAATECDLAKQVSSTFQIFQPSKVTSIEVQTDLHDFKNLMCSHFGSESTKLRQLSSSEPNVSIEPDLCFAEENSHISGMSDASLHSGQLDDLVQQLVGDMEHYAKLLSQLMGSRALKSEDLSVRNAPLEDNGSSNWEIGNLEKKLLQFQNLFESRRARMTELRTKKSKLKRAVMTPQSVQTIDPVEESDQHSTPPVQLSAPHLSEETSDTTEVEIDGWQDDDFPDLNSNTSDETKCQSILPDTSTNDEQQHHATSEKQLDILGQSASECPPNTEELKQKICDLEKRLRISEKEGMEMVEKCKSIKIIEALLNDAVSDLLNFPPPPTPPKHSAHFHQTDINQSLPRNSIEEKLIILTNAESSARVEINRLNNVLDKCKEQYENVLAENGSLQLQLDDLQSQLSQLNKTYLDGSSKSNVSQTELKRFDDFEPSDLAYLLSNRLNPDLTEKNWDPSQWELQLYCLLKSQLDESSGTTDDESDRVIQLTAEVAALRDILAKHNLFRTQAECDLKRLLSTINNQHEVIESLKLEKQTLKDKLSTLESYGFKVAVQNSPDVSENEVIANQEKLIDHEQLLLRLVNHIYSIHTQILNIDTNSMTPEPDSSSFISLFTLQGSNQLFVILDDILDKFKQVKVSIDQFQSVYDSVVNALKQKHAESQNYHQQLQTVIAKLNEATNHNEELEILITSLRSQLCDQSVDVNKENTSKDKHLQATDTTDDSNEPIEKHGKSQQQTFVPAIQRDCHIDFIVGDEELNSNLELMNAKLVAEIQRLQAHLLDVEESYTAEALNAENREVELRKRLASVELQVSKLKDVSHSSEDQIKEAIFKRDQAMNQLETYQSEIIDLKQSLSNLQSALENFQRNQEATIMTETERIRGELNRVTQRERDANLEIERLTTLLATHNQLNEELRNLRIRNQTFNEQLSKVESKVQQRDQEIEKLRARLAKMALDTDSRIDKILMKNLLISYLQLPTNQRTNGLKVIGSLLNFTDAEYSKVGSEASTFPKLINWVRSAVAHLPSGPPKDVLLSTSDPDKSFTELLLAFLEQESTPKSSIKLPIDHYTREAVYPTSSKHRQSVTEPQVTSKTSRSQNALLSNLPNQSVSNVLQSNNLDNLNGKPTFYML